MQRLTWLQLSDWHKRSRSLIGRWYAMRSLGAFVNGRKLPLICNRLTLSSSVTMWLSVVSCLACLGGWGIRRVQGVVQSGLHVCDKILYRPYRCRGDLEHGGFKGCIDNPIPRQMKAVCCCMPFQTVQKPRNVCFLWRDCWQFRQSGIKGLVQSDCLLFVPLLENTAFVAQLLCQPFS